MRSYKALSGVEAAFRCLKRLDLRLKPIFHRLDDRVGYSKAPFTLSRSACSRTMLIGMQAETEGLTFEIHAYREGLLRNEATEFSPEGFPRTLTNVQTTIIIIAMSFQKLNFPSPSVTFHLLPGGTGIFWR